MGIIGFSGESGTGKSWVAEKLATQLGFHYQPSRGAEVAAEINFDVNAPHTFVERLNYQEDVLEKMIEDNCLHLNAVFDRTPLDLAAYTIIAANSDPSNELLKQYVEDCYKTCDELFDTIVLVSPPYEELLGDCEYKPGRLIAEVHGYNHRALFDAVLKTLMIKPSIAEKTIVIPENLHFEERVKFVKERI